MTYITRVILAHGLHFFNHVEKIYIGRLKVHELFASIQG